MKIVNIVPGFGGTFYCGNCLRDSVYVRSLKSAGHDAVTLPIYLPLSIYNDHNDREIPMFYGAVNIYLKQNFKSLRHMPSWLEQLFNSKPILKYAAKKAGSTRAEGLEEMTISMLNGIEGYQGHELQQLVNYLKYQEKPDVVHLSNALLLGLVKHIKDELNIPVICSLQDEDVWIDAMHDDYRDKLWQLMSDKANEADALIAVSGFFAGIMKEKMNIPDHKLHVVHIGVETERYEMQKPGLNPPKIGYLSRMNEGNGFGVVIDAFIELKGRSAFKDVKLKVSGGHTGDDKRFIKRQVQKLKARNYLDDVEFTDEYWGDGLAGFFKSLTVLSVPVLKGEAFGLYQLESLASGIPIVQPALGAFPEIIEATGGGVIYHPNTPGALADKWEEVFSNPGQLQQMSIQGRKAVEERFNSRVLTENMIRVFKNLGVTTRDNNKIGTQ
jgi:glycosyltransferase involved in cell wall biosynthesis